jgi:hypothetical protein
MQLRTIAMVGALVLFGGLGGSLGCQSRPQGPTATVQGRVTDTDDQTVTLQVASGERMTLHLSARAGRVQVQKGQDVRATYREDPQGIRVADEVTVIPAASPPAP